MRPRVPFAVLLGLLAAACSPAPPAPPAEPPALAEGEGLLASGRPAAARRRILSVNPAAVGSPAGRLRLARAAIHLKEFAAAARALEADAADPRGAPEAAVLRAEALLRSGRVEDARAALAACEKAGVRDDRWRYVFALLNAATGDRESARRELDALAQEGARDAEVLLRWAEMQGDSPERARRRLAEILDRTSDRPRAAAAFGRWLLARGAEPGIAAGHLEEALAGRPFDRDARLDLVRARTRIGSGPALEAGEAEARRLLEDEPADREAWLVLAECLGAAGIRETSAAEGGFPPKAIARFEAAEAAYAKVLALGTPDRAAAIGALHGLARTHVERIPLDPAEAKGGPGTHFAGAMAALREAEALDPEGTLLGPWNVRLTAETHYLRGRACKRAHLGDMDHTVAIGHYRRAVELSRTHLEATWDLGLLLYDLLRTEDFLDEAERVMRWHVREREARGMPTLDPQRMAIYLDVQQRVKERKGLKPGEAAPKAPAPGTPPGKEPEKAPENPPPEKPR